MPRPIPTTVGHFTHIDNVPTIAQHGLLCDSHAHGPGLLTTEVGELSIKARRRSRAVTAGLGGVVADYVPFYFATRSPMMYSIHRGNVSTFSGDSHDLVYLVTTVEALIIDGYRPVYTDRNAVLAFSRQSDGLEVLDAMVDWDLMKATMWKNTDDDPDRKERRMAECLVHHKVHWSVFTQIVVHNAARADRVRTDLDRLGITIPPIDVRPGSYF
ncbi:MAG: DUF4433 domain-containing protein [Rhodococcus sp. (in: high G+C Gram-positive bacteria)]